jgi:hypothetical protein
MKMTKLLSIGQNNCGHQNKAWGSLLHAFESVFVAAPQELLTVGSDAGWSRAWVSKVCTTHPTCEKPAKANINHKLHRLESFVFHMDPASSMQGQYTNLATAVFLGIWNCITLNNTHRNLDATLLFGCQVGVSNGCFHDGL